MPSKALQGSAHRVVHGTAKTSNIWEHTTTNETPSWSLHVIHHDDAGAVLNVGVQLSGMMDKISLDKTCEEIEDLAEVDPADTDAITELRENVKTIIAVYLRNLHARSKDEAIVNLENTRATLQQVYDIAGQGRAAVSLHHGVYPELVETFDQYLRIIRIQAERHFNEPVN